MKHTRSLFLGTMAIMAAQWAGSGCAVGVGDGGGYGVAYGPDVWVHDDVWLNGGGRGWYGRNDGAYVHPDRGHPAASRPAPAAHAAAPHEGEHRP
jgi:hypothetical protein